MIRKEHAERDVMILITSDTQRGTGRVNTALRLAQALNEAQEDDD